VYDVSVTKQGFKKVTTRNVELHVSDITTVPIKLPVGGMVETVEVQATAVQVETQSGVVGNVVNGQEVRELPMNGRNFVQLTTLIAAQRSRKISTPRTGASGGRGYFLQWRSSQRQPVARGRRQQ